MDGGFSRNTAADMAGILELGGARYKILDELAHTPHRRDHYADSETTRPYSHGQDQPTDASRRVDIMERTLSELVNRIDDMTVSRDAGARRPPLQSACTQEAFVRAHMQRERMDIPAQEGKNDIADFFIRNPIPKPYMFVEKPELNCAKKKLEYRQNITANEYIHAYVAMICDMRARDPAVLLQQLRHLRDVAHDITKFQWPTVRAWTQGVFDSVEKGLYSWDDTQSIQNDRFLALRASHVANALNDEERVETICLEFNSRSCRHGGPKRDHSQAGVQFIHCCLYCYASSRDRQRCDHPLADCKCKEKHQSQHVTHTMQYAQQHSQFAPGAYGRPRFGLPPPASQNYSQAQYNQPTFAQQQYQPAAQPTKNQ